MDTDKIDPSKKDATISSADDLVKTTKKDDVELTEEELHRVRGGVGSFIKLGDIKGESIDDKH
jgi:hypothetical protein